jgi:pimeloyl-ACP methyl ester carboxylesterase
MTERVVVLADGRAVRTYDSGGPTDRTVVWHHGSPQTGRLLDPLLAAARERGMRLLSYGRPSYGGSTSRPGRDVASAAGDVREIADAYGIPRFAVMGASGGGPHALACAALLPERVSGAVCLAGIAPYDGTAQWFAGMAGPGGLRAALDGRAARTRYALTDEFDPQVFTAADHAALAGTWASLGADAQLAEAAGPDGLVDDDVAFVTPWGFELAAVRVPVLLVHGDDDRVVPPAHADRLAAAVPGARVWRRPGDGHVSVLDSCPAALDWLAAGCPPG